MSSAARAMPSADPILTLDAARVRIAADVGRVAGVEQVALRDALGRVLADDLIASVAVPAHDNAAMDGYALRSDGTSSHRTLRTIGTARAGEPFPGRVGHGACVRILTGAVMPDDCDAVVAQEDVRVADGVVTIDGPVRSGQHRRLAGEDLKIGSIVIPRGRRVTPSDIGLAASVGVATLTVVRKLRVAVFSTGRELRDLEQPLDRGSIRDSNRHTLIGMLGQLGADVIDLGIVDDDPATLEATIRHACTSGTAADAIVTSGGVSAGDADHMRTVMERLGRVAFWKLAIKPGRPMAFGRVTSAGRHALLFGLPGNPVAVMVVFRVLVRDALLALMGAHPEPTFAVAAICDEPLDKTTGRSEFLRAIAVRTEDGWHVRPTASQGSGVLRSMSEANCLIALEHDRGPVHAGEWVETWPFHGV